MDKEELRKRMSKAIGTFENQMVRRISEDCAEIAMQYFTEQLNKHGVMQGCQCKDRIGETTVWCCNQCGLPCENGWLPTNKPFRQPTVGDGAAGQNVRDVTWSTYKKGDELYGG